MALLVKLSPGDVKPQQLVGTDLVHAVPNALIGGLAYGVAGLVSLHLLVNLLLGSIPGVILGSLLSSKLSDSFLNASLSVLLIGAVALVIVRSS